MAIGKDDKKFIGLACINIVVAANAGGAFSPFGDITTLMVWQKGIIQFQDFFALFIPSVVNWLVPAAIMSLAVPDKQPESGVDDIKLKPGAFVIIGRFLWTIATAVSFHNFLKLPPVVGMMAGLSLLNIEHSGNVCRPDHDAGYVPGAVATCHDDCWSWGELAFHWFSRRGGTYGAGKRQIYLFRPPQVVSGNCLGIRNKYLSPFPH